MKFTATDFRYKPNPFSNRTLSHNEWKAVFSEDDFDKKINYQPTKVIKYDSFRFCFFRFLQFYFHPQSPLVQIDDETERLAEAVRLSEFVDHGAKPDEIDDMVLGHHEEFARMIVDYLRIFNNPDWELFCILSYTTKEATIKIRKRDFDSKESLQSITSFVKDNLSEMRDLRERIMGAYLIIPNRVLERFHLLIKKKELEIWNENVSIGVSRGVDIGKLIGYTPKSKRGVRQKAGDDAENDETT